MQHLEHLQSILSGKTVTFPLPDQRRKALNLLYRGQVGALVLEIMASRYHALPLHVEAPLSVRLMLGNDIPDGSVVDFIAIIMTAILTGIYDTKQTSKSRVERTITRSESKSGKKKLGVPLRTEVMKLVMADMDAIWFEELRRFTGSDLMVALSKPLLTGASDAEWSDWLRALTQPEVDAMSQRVCMRLLFSAEAAWLKCVSAALGLHDKVRELLISFIDAHDLVPSTGRTVVRRTESNLTEYETMLSKSAMKHREELYTEWDLGTHIPVSHHWDRLCATIPTDACAGALPVQVHADVAELLLHKSLIFALRAEDVPEAVGARTEEWFNDWLRTSKRPTLALLTDKETAIEQFEECNRACPPDDAAADPDLSDPAEAAAAEQ